MTWIRTLLSATVISWAWGCSVASPAHAGDKCLKCGGKRTETWLCLREAGCTARPRYESTELRQPPLPFDGEYHAHRRCLDCSAEWASLDLGHDDCGAMRWT